MEPKKPLAKRTTKFLLAWAARLRAPYEPLLRIRRPDLETGMSTFTPDFDHVDKAEVTDRGRISPPQPNLTEW